MIQRVAGARELVQRASDLRGGLVHSVEEVLGLLKPKLDKPLDVSDSVDMDQRVDEIDIESSNWREVLDQVAAALELEVVEEDEKLTLSARVR